MAPVKKKARNEDSNDLPVTADDLSSGFIRFEVENVSKLTGSMAPCSSAVEVYGMPWNLSVQKVIRTSGLGVYIRHRDSSCNIWSVDVSADFKLINIGGVGASIIKKLDKTFNYKTPTWGFHDFFKWDDLMNEEKGFIKDDKIVVELRFTLSNITGIRTTSLIDFTDPNEPCHDVALVIDGVKVYASKQILGVHSPVLKAMFYGNFVEKDKKEIELKDVDRKVFIEMLNLIYPSYKKISDVNAEPLLKLADRFQIKTIIDQVEQYLIDSDKFNISSKLKLSDQFRLVKLQDHCLDQLKTVQEVKDLKETDGYKALSNDAKATLMEKVMRL